MPILCQWSRLFVSLLVGIPSESECLYTTLVIFFARLVVHIPPVSLRRVDHIISGVLMAVVVGRVYVWPIEPHFLRNLPNVCHQPLWWWYRWWIHIFTPLRMWYLLLRGLPLQDVLLTNVSPTVGVRIGVESLGHLCPRINPGVDRCLGLLPLHWKSYILLVRVWRKRITSGRERLARLLFQCMLKRL